MLQDQAPGDDGKALRMGGAPRSLPAERFPASRGALASWTRTVNPLLPRPLAVLLLLAVLVQPTASAGGTLDAAVLTVDVEDAFGRSCPFPVAGFCLFLVQGDGMPRNLTVDAYQRLDYVGVATDFSLFREHLGGAWLLPDRAMTVRGSDLYVPHPAFSTATEAWNGVERPEETDRVGMTKKNVSVVYAMPSFSEPGRLDPQYWAMGYGEGMEYDRLGPFNTPKGNTSDAYYWAVVEVFCPQDGRCSPTTSGVVAAPIQAAPRARVGLELYDVQVATDPADLTPPAPTVLPAPSTPAPLRSFADAAAEPEDEEAPAPKEDSPAAEAGAPPASRRAPPPAPEPPRERVRVLGQAPAAPPPELPLAAILGATAAGLLLAALGAALYSRFHGRAEMLRSATRERLVALVREKPGVCLADAAEALGIGRTAVLHHVRMLERAQVIRVRAESKRRALYLAGPKQPETPPAWLLRNASCAAIVRAAQATPGGLPREEVRRLLPDVPARTRNYHLQRLLASGALMQVETPEGVRVLRVASAEAR